jgi:hypothetical protein
MKIFNIMLRSALFIGFAFLGSSLSCDIFDKADDITFDVEISHTFVIDENLDSPTSVSYFDSDMIDPNQNAEFAKYKDKIQELTINEVTYTVTNYDPATPGVIFTNGMGSFSATAGSSAAFASADLAIQNIQASVGGSFTLNYSVSDLQQIATRMQDLQPVFFQVSGTFSSTPVAFSVPVVLHCTIKADAL